MTDIFDSLQTDVQKILYHRVRVKYFERSSYNQVADGNYDDDVILAQSGTSLWMSGLVMPIKGKWGSSEALLLEQGKIKTSDKVLYIAGTQLTDGILKVGIGSPTIVEHFIVPDGVEIVPPTGSSVYKKLYCRVLPTGSLAGEM